MITQLAELIQVETPLGPGWAILVEATAHDYFWTVALGSGALVTFTQDKICVSNSYTLHRGISDEKMREIVSTPSPGFTRQARGGTRTSAKGAARCKR